MKTKTGSSKAKLYSLVSNWGYSSIRVGWRLILALALIAALGIFDAPEAAHGRPDDWIYVNTFVDEYNSGEACSLREAITAATGQVAFGGCNAGGTLPAIVLQTGTYSLTREGHSEDNNAWGDLDIDASGLLLLIIGGQGKADTIIDGDDKDRVFHILDGVVNIQNMTIQNGSAPDGLAGANGVASGSNGDSGGAGANGGGIYNAGDLTLQSVIVKNNDAGQGGVGGNGQTGYTGAPSSTGGTGGDGGTGGRGGHGGGIYNMDELTIYDSLIQSNYAGDGAPGGAGGQGGTGGAGFSSSSSGDRDGGYGGLGGDGGHGGLGGHGGGIYNAGTGDTDIHRSDVFANYSGYGGTGGAGGRGGTGGKGNDQTSGLSSDDWGYGGWGGFGGLGGNAGSAGQGAGIYHLNGGTLVIKKSNINVNNGAIGGVGGVGGKGGSGGAGGDALWDDPGCSTGYGGLGRTGGKAGDGGVGTTGGGIYAGGTISIEDTYIRANDSGVGGAGGTGGGGGDGGQPGSTSYSCSIGQHGDNGTGGNGGNGGPGGNGAGLLISGPGLHAPEIALRTILRTTIAQNTTADGGVGGTGGPGGYNLSAGYSYGGDGGDGGNGGDGGGIYNIQQNINIDNSTISGNLASSDGARYGYPGIGENGDGVIGISGHPGKGGGAYIEGPATVKLRNVTVVYNKAEGNEYPSYPDGVGGGLYSTVNDLIDIGHSLIGYNDAYMSPNCKGRLATSGWNLQEDQDDCGLNASLTSDKERDDLGIAPNLADIGGYAPTHRLLRGSPAIDMGYTYCMDGESNVLTTDQRGYPRPVDHKKDGTTNCDAGAVEAQIWIYLPVVIK